MRRSLTHCGTRAHWYQLLDGCMHSLLDMHAFYRIVTPTHRGRTYSQLQMNALTQYWTHLLTDIHTCYNNWTHTLTIGHTHSQLNMHTHNWTCIHTHNWTHLLTDGHIYPPMNKSAPSAYSIHTYRQYTTCICIQYLLSVSSCRSSQGLHHI